LDNQELRKLGLKVTNPRVKILGILENTQNRHMTAEDVYKSLLSAGEDVGLATVYRVLTQFESVDLVTKHYFEGDHAVYELNQGEHHDHLVCVKCGKVEEFMDETIEQRQQQIATKAAFKMTDHSLNIYGLCAACQ